MHLERGGGGRRLQMHGARFCNARELDQALHERRRLSGEHASQDRSQTAEV